MEQHTALMAARLALSVPVSRAHCFARPMDRPCQRVKLRTRAVRYSALLQASGVPLGLWPAWTEKGVSRTLS